MKRPRLEDFDPNAAAKLKSSMDDLPHIGRPKRARRSPEALRALDNQEQQKAPVAPSELGSSRFPAAVRDESPEELIRTPVRPSVRTDQRTLTRMPFEIYRDQHAALKQFSLEEQTRGEKGSMSQMVREALDAYINKRRGDEGRA